MSDLKILDAVAGTGQLLIEGIRRFDIDPLNAFYSDIDPGHVATFQASNKKFDLNIPKRNITQQDFLSMSIPKGDFVLVGNPPYNDEGQGRSPIYQKFLQKCLEFDPKHMIYIIPTNWFTQPNNKLGKEVRQTLRALGVYKIAVNDLDLFTTARVSTCTVFCKQAYQGDISLVNSAGQSKIIPDFDDYILTEFDEVAEDLLMRLRPTEPFKTYKSSKESKKWSVATSYMCYNDLRDKPLNDIKVLPPGHKGAGGYRTFVETKTKKQAEEFVEYYDSFWHSKLVQFILKRTRSSTTLDNPQISWVPVIDIDKTYTDQELYKLFKLTKKEVSTVENDFAEES